MINFANLALAINTTDYNEMESFSTNFLKILPIILIGFGLLFIAAFIFVICLTAKELKKNNSSRTTFVPFSSDKLKDDLPMPEKSHGNKCIHCGMEIAQGSEYCNHCEKKQVRTYTKIFNRENMNNEEFIEMINTWLASNDRVANVECKMLTNTGYGLLVNKFYLDSVALKFELFRNPNENQYALTMISKYGFKRTETSELIDQWKAYNPKAKIIKTAGGTTMRGKSGVELYNGLGASNNAQIFVFFKIPRKKQ